MKEWKNAFHPQLFVRTILTSFQMKRLNLTPNMRFEEISIISDVCACDVTAVFSAHVGRRRERKKQL